MYVNSCKSVDVRIDIVKYEEGFHRHQSLIMLLFELDKTKCQFHFKQLENMEKEESKLTKIKVNGLTNKSLQTFPVDHFWKILWL